MSYERGFGLAACHLSLGVVAIYLGYCANRNREFHRLSAEIAREGGFISFEPRGLLSLFEWQRVKTVGIPKSIDPLRLNMIGGFCIRPMPGVQTESGVGMVYTHAWSQDGGRTVDGNKVELVVYASDRHYDRLGFVRWWDKYIK